MTLRVLLLCSLSACPAPPRAMSGVGTADGPCPDFSDWTEITSPFEGERCFKYDDSEDDNGIVCKRAESVYLTTCADPKKRPDQKPPEGAVTTTP